MVASTVSGPFRPGTGRLPPHLAGRRREQELFDRLLAGLAQGEPAPADALLYGPRGNGKTTLLSWIESRADESPELDALWLVPSAIPDETRLVERLLPASFWSRFAPAEASAFGITWRPGGNDPPPLDLAITARARRRPLVVLLDEAHTLRPEVGGALLNASQMAGRRTPFLLVLAGTPDVRDRLGEMNASFWNRAQLLSIGRLDDEASAAAVREPLREDGLSIADQALARIVAESHGYPFFLQLWGDAVWVEADAARRSGSPEPVVTVEAVERAAPEFERRRREYYHDRYREMEDADLLGVAAAVAGVFARSPRVSTARLRSAIVEGLGEGSDPERIGPAETMLRQTGFVWRGGGETSWEPGIPSLMDYMREEIAENAAAAP